MSRRYGRGHGPLHPLVTRLALHALEGLVMKLTEMPDAASWQHRGARTGFEIAVFEVPDSGYRIRGATTARESDALWSVGYDVTTDAAWRTVTVQASVLAPVGRREVSLTRDADDRWFVGGEHRPELDGCVDVDFESSAVTNTLPLHRLAFEVGVRIDVPATFVRADDLRVERLDQRYTLIEVTPQGPRFHYESTTFAFECELQYDPAGLVVEYPGIAVRES